MVGSPFKLDLTIHLEEFLLIKPLRRHKQGHPDPRRDERFQSQTKCSTQILPHCRIQELIFGFTDLTAPQMKKDERDVSGLVSMLDSNWTNPFGDPSELISLST